MKKLKIIGGLILATSAVLFACRDEFLEVPAQGALSEEVLSTPEGVEALLISTYSMLDGWAGTGAWGAAASHWIFGSVASDDAYKGSEAGDQQAAADVELYQWSTGEADSYLRDRWVVLYDGVSRANSTLNLMAEVEGISEEAQNRIMGEALFLRAHYHFEGYRLWENIPYYTEEDEDFRKSNEADALPLILADLETAIANLPLEQGDVGRVTQWTAKAYLGRVQMFAQDFAAAQATLNDVVENGPYALQDCYHDVFSGFGENGTETVLAYQASVNDGEPNGENGNHPDRLTFPHSGSPFGCCGFHQPSQNLVNAYKVDANGLPLISTFNNADLTAADPVDPRLDWVVGRDDVPFLDWGLHAPGWIRDRGYSGPYSAKKPVYEQGSGAGSDVGWSAFQLHYKNLHLLRYADVILMLAEAEVELGNLERGRELVNLIRERAGNCVQGPDGVAIATTIDDPAVTWATYSVEPYTAPWTDANAARAAVRMERRLELALEGHRLFDLRRWGIAQEVLNDYLEVEKTKRVYLQSATPYQERHQLYPIPSFERELSTVGGEDRLIQNDGW